MKRGRDYDSSSYLTVKALTKYIKRKFDADPHLREVYVKGELSNVKIHTSGHIYFTLKDDDARINATMFRTSSSKANLSFKPEEGMQVFIRGDVNVYEVWWNLSIICANDGAGWDWWSVCSI